MFRDMIIYLGLYLFGIITGVGIIRYGIGLGSKMHVKAESGASLDEETKVNIQEFSK